MILATAVLSIGTSCSTHRPAGVEVRKGTCVFGVYRGFVDRGDGDSQRVRLLLYAELPDRIHAEVMPPVGSAFLIIDGGGGRLSIASPREGVAYVGEPGATTLEEVIGVPATLEGFVRALLLGQPIEGGVTVLRSPEGGPGLPERIELRSGARRLGIELREARKTGSCDERIGTGSPPPGIEGRPLEDLEIDSVDGALIDPEHER